MFVFQLRISFPRTRGDEPKVRPIASIFFSFSPHARG